MTKNILEKIIDNRIIEIEERKSLVPIERLINNISDYEYMYKKKFYDFKKRINDNIRNNKISIIAEMKKASPSAGVILKNYKPIDIAKIYKNNNATCLSVLAEEKYFLGEMM